MKIVHNFAGMNLFDKIESVRKKPKHIRMRYVLVCVIVSLIFVIIIWISSFQSKNWKYEQTDEKEAMQIFDKIQNKSGFENK